MGGVKGVRLQKAGTMEVSIGKHRRTLETFSGGGGELEVHLRLLVESMTQDYCCPLCSYTSPPSPCEEVISISPSVR